MLPTLSLQVTHSVEAFEIYDEVRWHPLGYDGISDNKRSKVKYQVSSTHKKVRIIYNFEIVTIKFVKSGDE